MPRNGSGTYALPAGNPVSSGTLIEASWANTTLSDIASAVTDSLARSGEGGMTGPMRATDGTVSTPSVSFVSETATGFYRAGATDVRFAMAGVDVATLTTAGVTVGSTKVLALPDGTAAAPALTNTGDTNTGVFFPADNTVAVTTDGTERVRVDASGNLGLGVTPSAWNVGSAIDISSRGSISDSSAVGTSVGRNAYYNAGWKYKLTSASQLYLMDDGGHKFFTAPSGTAGNAISFTQAMTLDASGNLLVGTTSNPAYTSKMRLQGGLEIHASQQLNILPGNTNPYEIVNRGNGGIDFYPTATTLGARISSSGLFYVGTTSGSAGFNLNSGATSWLNIGASTTSSSFGTFYKGGTSTPVGYIGTDGGGIIGGASGDNFGIRAESALLLLAGASERARITSGGDLLVGTTSQWGYFDGKLNVNGRLHTYVDTDTERNYFWNSGTGTRYFLSFVVGSVGSPSLVGNITSDGSTTSYGTTSDYRLKENIQPMTGGLAKVAQLKPCTYTWKANGTAGQGFIAHELAEVVPDAVTGEKDAVNEDGSIKAQGIDTSYLVATLTAALQEAHALIKSLEQRVAALEAQS